jgi:hypothetical protein
MSALAVPVAYLVHGADSTIILYVTNLVFYPLGVALALGSPSETGGTRESLRGQVVS